MGKRIKKIAKICVLGAVGIALTAGLTGCSNELKSAQNNIDNSVVDVLNGDENFLQDFGGEISKFTFLCADTEKTNNNNEYVIDINGIVTEKDSKQKAYTTLNYQVDGKYFDQMKKADNANIINALTEIVKNEDYKSIVVNKVNNVKNLNSSVGKSTDSPLKNYSYSSNFLYGIGKLEFDEKNNTVSFTTKENVKFSNTTVSTHWGVVGFGSDGGLEYGMVTSTDTDYKSFFVDQKIYVALEKEDFEKAKNDESIVFEKFSEYVSKKEKDKYVVQVQNVVNEKDFSAVMKDDVKLEKA